MSESALAIFGGAPTVIAPHPHVDRLAFTADDLEAIQQFAEGGNPLSYYGREGIVRELEDELARYFSHAYCLLTNSGTNALHSAYFAIGLGPGDEVIVPTNTFFATVTPLFQLGAIPVLADCEPDTGNISPVSIRQNLTSNTRAIVVTHLWGHPADMPAIVQIAQSHDLRLVEDISLAVGSTLEGQRAGSFGDAACLSLGSTKLLGGGQGGALLVSDRELYERATLLGHFGNRSRQEVLNPFYRRFTDVGYGHNYRIHVLAAAMAFRRFQRLDSLISQRHQRFYKLGELLDHTNLFIPPEGRAGVFRGSWQGYLVDVAPQHNISAAVVEKALQAEGLEVTSHSDYPLLHLAPFFQTEQDGLWSYNRIGINKRLYKAGDFPVAEAYIQSKIFFPLFLDEPIELVEQYGEACLKVARHAADLRKAG